ncbi:MAG: 4Fe-4S dicluster domain-containing protein [Desulfovibrio sp.]|jgi:Fe-S-cluster-containing dehydrogenase component|nr:4Fe-4S dicluster domain-containing protein [Desulfovibrio sp.]
MNRRKFLTILGTAGVASAMSTARVAEAGGGVHMFPYWENSYGVLHDTTRCIGCRRCEEGCNKVNNLPKPKKPFADLTVCNTRRRTSAYEWTVVNKYSVDGKPVFRKLQCFHCNDPACAAACFAKCFSKNADGSVTYDGTQCVGCRYCMIACPFYMPGFQYDEAFDPLVQKCTFCAPRLKEGKLPGCVEACPMDALTFGRRSDLIKLARARIKDHPDKYLDYIYGEWDAGGTAWMVLGPKASTPPPAGSHGDGEMKALGLDTQIGNRPVAELTYGALGAVPMIVAFWPVLFGGAYAMTKRKEAIHKAEQEAVEKQAKDDVTTALDAAVRKIEETQGQPAADAARKAMTEALKSREALDSCHASSDHGEGK